MDVSTAFLKRHPGGRAARKQSGLGLLAGFAIAVLDGVEDFTFGVFGINPTVYLDLFTLSRNEQAGGYTSLNFNSVN